MIDLKLNGRLSPSIACLLSVILCLAYAATRSQLPDWWRHHGGGIPYVMFWIFLWFTLLPNRSLVAPICILCVLFICALEVFQLYDGPKWLQEFRTTKFGAAWLGRGFDWFDIPPYFIGGLISWLVGNFLFPKKNIN